MSAGVVLAGSGSIALAISVVLYFSRRHLPSAVQDLLGAVNQASWQAGVEAVVGVAESFGTHKELAFLTLQSLQSIVAPIPGQLTSAVAGLVFGFWHGLWLSMLGMAIGSSIALLATRILGRPMLNKLAPKAALKRFDFLMKEEGLAVFWVIFLLPALPDDSVCLLAGLTRLPVWKVLVAATVGRLPGTASVVMAGAAADTHPLVTQLLVALGVLLTLAAWIFDDEIARSLQRRTRPRRRTGSAAGEEPDHMC